MFSPFLSASSRTLTSFAAGSRVKISVSRACRRGSMEKSQNSGTTCSGSSKPLDLVGLSLRIALLYELGEPIRSSGGWKHLVTPAGRSCWALGLSEPRTDETGFSSWATPVSNDKQHRNATFQQGGTALSTQATWPTPVSREGGRHANGTETLTSSATWPTPVSQDAKGSGASGYSTLSGRHSGVTLTDAAVRWNTPRARDWKGAGKDCLDDGRLVPWNRSIAGSPRGRLNSKWVAGLMGFPIDWLSIDGSENLRRSALRLCRKSQRPSGGPSSK